MASIRLSPQLVVGLTRPRPRISHLCRPISTLKSASSSTSQTSLDPFAAFDRLNKNTTVSKQASKWANPTPSTSVPLSPTTDSPGQSAAIESHPSTSAEDLHPLPPSTNITESSSQSPEPHVADLADSTVNWSRSFSGLSQKPFPKEASDILMSPLDPADVEIKPDGVVYLPEIKYRRILNRAFGPGGWGLAPRGASHVTSRNVSREYALICLGRLVSLARGEQDYYNGADNIPTATEGCKSNALMRCCKDLGVASELWDPNYIQWWKNKYATVEWVLGTGLSSGKKKPVWKKKRLEDWSPRLPS